jgi:hypothetical protein
MGTAKTYRAKHAVSFRKHQTVRHIINQTKSPEPQLSIVKPVVFQNGKHSHILRPPQRNAMLGDIGSIFRGIELDFRLLNCIYEINR